MRNIGGENHYGVCDLERRVQPVGKAYRPLFANMREHISSGMLTLD